MAAGIFKIKNNVTGQVFLGLSRNIKYRLDDYKYLRNNVETQTNIFLSILEHGPENHSFSTVHEFTKSYSRSEEREILAKFIKNYRKRGIQLLNASDGRGGSSKWSEEKKRLKGLAMKGRGYGAGTPIIQYDEKGKFIKEWESITKASNDLGIDYNLIVKAAKKKKGLIGGFQWRYNEKNPIFRPIRKVGQVKDGKTVKIFEVNKLSEAGFNQMNVNTAIRHNHKSYGYNWVDFGKAEFTGTTQTNIEPYVRFVPIEIPVLQYGLDGHFIAEWKSAHEAAKKTGVSSKTIQYQIRHQNKPNKYSNDRFIYQWSYKTEEFPLRIKRVEMPYVGQYDTNGVLVACFQSNKTAAYGIKGATAKKILIATDHVKPHFGFYWRRFVGFIGDMPQRINTEIPKKPRASSVAEKANVPVNQFTIEGKFVKRWDSYIDAAQILDVFPSSIKNACNLKLKRVARFQWRWADGKTKVNSIPPIAYKTKNYSYKGKRYTV